MWHYTYDFFFIQKKCTLEFHWLCLPVGLLMDYISSLGCPGIGYSITELSGNCGASLWAPKGNIFCDVLLKGAFHITFGQIPRTNPWFYFSSRYYQFHFLPCYGEGKLIAGQGNNIQLENIWSWRHGHSLKDPLNEGEKNVEAFSCLFS